MTYVDEKQAIEKKWQDQWKSAKVYKAEPKDKNFYALEMYPYPSANGLHMGHAFNFMIGDVIARKKRKQGFGVLHPMGFDSFGLPAENAAIKHKAHPKQFTEQAIENFKTQMDALGMSYDWDATLQSHDPSYYKWDQWIFLKMYEKGLAYKKTSPVNWCPQCQSVLANEQVINGKCWRHAEQDVEIKNLNQWFFKTTAYADELYEGIDKLDGWPERTKAMQRNWIGKSYGTTIHFEINGKPWPVFTTRPDTIFGVTFVVVAAQHKELDSLVSSEQRSAVDAFLDTIKSTSEKDLGDLDKVGVFTGSYAVNPANGKKVPIYAGNFVVADYASGMVMAVPAHDQRDFEFAKKYGIAVKVVIQPDGEQLDATSMKRAYTENGTLVNSGEFTGLKNREAIEKITDWLASSEKGEKTVQFKLRDWGISRQRFWGTPIPIIYCDDCGAVPVPEKDLPVKLPGNMVLGQTEGNPLASNPDFVNCTCPKCGNDAKRETDTMDTFVNSSWYFLRYCDNKNSDAIFAKDKVMSWAPPDLYIGGAEHACMHLIYSRFYVKFLRDLGLLDFDEPASWLYHQGMLHGEDGFVMSKSRGNGVDPLEAIAEYGADSLRLFLVSVASPDKDFSWSTTGMQSIAKFIGSVYDYFSSVSFTESSDLVAHKINSAIESISNDIDSLKYNNAVITLRKTFAVISAEGCSRDDALTYLSLLHPFCPHMTEELFVKLGGSDSMVTSSWPEADSSKIDASLDALEDIIDTVKADVASVLRLVKISDPKKITLMLAPEWKYTFVSTLKDKLEETANPKELIAHFMSSDMKQYGKDIVKMIPMFAKNRSKLPKVVVERSREADALRSLDFGCEVAVVLDSDNPKVRNAMPGKPAILVE